MIKTSLPRFILKLSLSGVMLVTSVITLAPKGYAQNPCPKGMTCSASAATSVSSASTSATASSSASTGGILLQVVMVLLGIS